MSQEELYLTGTDGAEFIFRLGGVQNIYSTLRDVEQTVIKGIVTWFEQLKEYGHYNEIVDVRGAWSIEKTQPHEVIVECTAYKPISEGLGRNAMPVFWTETGLNGEEQTREYRMIGGQYKLNTSIRCRSTKRDSVMYLADAVIQGLNADIRTYLNKEEITIPANPSQLSDKPQRETIGTTTTVSYWFLNIMLNDVLVNWKSIVEIDGNIIKDYSMFIMKEDPLIE